jgi:hypothetical protein
MGITRLRRDIFPLAGKSGRKRCAKRLRHWIPKGGFALNAPSEKPGHDRDEPHKQLKKQELSFLARDRPPKIGPGGSGSLLKPSLCNVEEERKANPTSTQLTINI